MAEINFDFRNVGSKKCAVSSPRIVNLEIGEESPRASEPAFQDLDFFLIDQHCHNDVKNDNSLICKYDKQNDKNFLIHSQSFLSTSTCDDHPSDKIKLTSDSDTDFHLLDLLNSAESEQAVGTKAKNFNFKINTSDDKMKIISNTEIIDGSSDILSSIANEISEKDEVDATLKDYQRKNSQDCEIDILDFDFVNNGCADSLSSNNSSLKVEGNLSDLLSSINIEDSDVSKVGSFSSNSMCNSKIANKFETIKEPCISDLSDLLSSIDLGDSNDNKGGSCNQNNNCYTEVLETENSLADILSSTNIDKSNKPTSGKEPRITNLSDLLSSIDLEDSNYNDNCNQADICNTYIVETKKELCLAEALPTVDINKSAAPTSTVLSSKPLHLGGSNLCFKDSNGTTDLLNDLTFDFISGSSSTDSCSSSYSDKENTSPKESLIESNLTDKVLGFDSGYSSFDSMHKDFSFFDYSSNNQFSFDKLLTNKSDTSIAMKNGKNEHAGNTNEEMSMSDLMTIVSPEFKNPVLSTLNKTDQLIGCENEDSSSMLDLMECLNNKSNNSNSHVISNCTVECDEKLLNYDCVDSPVSKNILNGMKTINSETEVSLMEDDILIGRNDYVDDNDKIASDDEQINFIDLRECIKSAKHQFPPVSPNKQLKNTQSQSSEIFSPNKILLYCEDKSPSDLSQNRSNSIYFNDMTPKKKSRVNTKQTMFSKALACKPKKDISLLQKVANIKNEILNSIMNRPVFIDCHVPPPVQENVIQSDRCILSNVGRKSFGLDTPCELQY
ncbi:hypothetical protein HNY73_009492 [Argiope bruennichi]|uniref:Uncharacterized protein n=1 Tax=Argiope bruennichi TaxID=94029 RepID=A0A8T0F9T9_ARGBR|nr:hypothetical protein HNY73_009492 [Argiope bruennichi]